MHKNFFVSAHCCVLFQALQINSPTFIQLFIYCFQVLPLVHVELEPGDALFFHCNLLHQSDQNSSDRRRWAFLIAYNRASNNPVFEHHHPQYTPLVKVIVKLNEACVYSCVV